MGTILRSLSWYASLAGGGGKSARVLWDGSLCAEQRAVTGAQEIADVICEAFQRGAREWYIRSGCHGEGVVERARPGVLR